MNEFLGGKNMARVESFELDHEKVKAPYVRLAGSESNQGVLIQKYDLRFLQPNQDALPTAAIHTLEHLLAVNLRDEVKGIIDLSPMGCRTGFYLIVWGEHSPEEIRDALKKVLKEHVVGTDFVPAVSAKECGNYRDHSLFSAQEYAKKVLEEGISSDPFERLV
ncbi:S-ribosylhomocysteine lyase [Enterococcus phoeniculicola]|jgi:S-ribosylhomocysteine lyase|nr:S-ribosylhomocysteine lyase [Enterococcus phoeniculicola]